VSVKLPEGELLYAVGDIHGRPDLLADLLRQIEVDAAHRGAVKKTLVFLGDYVDRGPDSCGVVEMLLNDLPEGFETRVLKGNHEAMLLAALPEAHLNFFKSLKLMIADGDYLFVHAGVRPGVPIEAQSEKDLLWIRGEFLESDEAFGKVVVHGHTPLRVPEVLPNRIGIDTGAVFTGQLTALRLQDGELGFLQT
jgi:serine/threonine protein phosphatase 1